MTQTATLHLTRSQRRAAQRRQQKMQQLLATATARPHKDIVWWNLMERYRRLANEDNHGGETRTRDNELHPVHQSEDFGVDG